MTTGCIYRFRLGRDAGGAYVGELVDDYGWTIALRAEVAERDGVKVLRAWGRSRRRPCMTRGRARRSDD